MFDMKQILVRLDERTSQLLERYVPARGRKRSKFIREAVVRAIMDIAEVATRRAYEKQPDDGARWFDPENWAPAEEAIRPTPSQMRAIERARKRTATHARSTRRRKRR
jgi:hypothetical protein